MSLEVNDVAVVVLALALEEVVEPHFVQGGGGRKRRNVPTDAIFRLVALHHHRQRVPADEALDAALDLAAARKRRLVLCGDGVEVRSVGGGGLSDVVCVRINGYLSVERS